MKAVYTILTVLLLASANNVTSADDPVLWDLAKNEIPNSLKSGIVEKADRVVHLRDGAAFAVPAEAFPDQTNFTVQVTLSLDALVQNAVFTVMNKQSSGQDDGFAMFFNYRDKPAYARAVNSVVNKILMVGGAINGRAEPEINKQHTFTMAVRAGLAAFYIDGVPIKTCFMELIPNHEPMWIGRNDNRKANTMPVTIHGVKVFGPAYQFVAKNGQRPGESTRGAVAGKGWALDIPKIEHPEWPKVLILGDSISKGYSEHFISEMLKQQVYVFHCVGFVGGEVPEQAYTEMAGRYKFDTVVFNNGLHSLSWTPDKVSDAVVRERYRKLAQCFKKGAPQAKLFYLLTTPHTAARPAPGTPVTSFGDLNDVVIRLNTLAAQVMKEEGIELIDAYSLLASRLELAAGDNFHWGGPAYPLLSQEIAKRVLPTLKKGN
ncbi:MAG: SGNH/GDSL hydrolase family protein [Planctomycetota bacterium]|nr:SGNH/GDSL hydrolase family protein [Planctomycetota bacterium]